MNRTTAVFVDGIGAAAANSGVLSQLQGRIFGLLYLQEHPLALEHIATELQQSKSNVSVNIRGLIDWHLVRRVPVPGSRKDHYEAATNFWRVMQEVMERRFRWAVRQVLAAVGEVEPALAEAGGRHDAPAFARARLGALRAFFAAVDAGIGAFTEGQPVDPETMKNVLPLAPFRTRQRS
jgi:DNA-binding transcriptional regulator GbsR (MarR family)